MKKRISILGCGWLGLPLAAEFTQAGYFVKGATTSPEKVQFLESFQISPYLVKVQAGTSADTLLPFLDSDILFLNIPFRRKLEDPNEYHLQIRAVVSAVESSPVRWVIFASSTSVYPASLMDASENAQFIPDNSRSAVLKKTEDMLLWSDAFDATVIRFAGLYGAQRQIGAFLSGKKVERANSPVNLIHLDDCVAIVRRIVEKDIRGEIFNACSDGHPLRKDLYTQAAVHLGLQAPEFTDGNPAPGKVVNNSKIKRHLKYQFKYPDPLKSF